MDDKHKTYVIVGGGLTGFSAARALRAEGFSGHIVLFGEELDPPYERPPLSKERLRDEISVQRMMLRLPEDDERDAIELQLGERVVDVDPTMQCVHTESGRTVLYDKLLIATGTELRRLNVPGHDLAGVQYLRTLRDCDALRAMLQRRPHVLVVGTGFLGCEVAASARQLGCEVTLTGPELPLAHVLGKELSQIYAGYHRGQNATVNVGVKTEAFRGAGHVEEAVFSDGSKIACDLVVVGIGVSPSVKIVADHVKIDNGIVTDEFCRTSVEGIFAAGDVANSWHPRLGRRARLEHFDNAQRQGEAAGKVMAGKPEAFDTVPFFFSDQYEFSLIYRGNVVSWDNVAIRGKPQEGSFSAFYLQEGRIGAVCSVNRYAESVAAQQLLGRADIDVRRLADDATQVDELVSSTCN